MLTQLTCRLSIRQRSFSFESYRTSTHTHTLCDTHTHHTHTHTRWTDLSVRANSHTSTKCRHRLRIWAYADRRIQTDNVILFFFCLVVFSCYLTTNIFKHYHLASPSAQLAAFGLILRPDVWNEIKYCYLSNIYYASANPRIDGAEGILCFRVVRLSVRAYIGLRTRAYIRV